MSLVQQNVGLPSESLRLVAFVAPVAVVAVLERAALLTVGPFAVALVPPVATAAVFAKLAPRIRTALPDDARRQIGSTAGRKRGRVRSAALGATLLHPLALAGGAALFLLVDTPVRYGRYWLGHGPLPLRTIVPVTVVGVTAGTLVAWGVLAVGVVRVSRGESVRRGVASALLEPLGRPLATALTAGLVVAAMGTAFGLVRAFPPEWAVPDPVAMAFAVGLLAVALVATAALVSHQFARAGRAPLTVSSGGRLTPARVTVAALLVTGLVLAAGAVRVSETRPMDTDPAALPDDPTEAYATAVNNTARSNVAITVDPIDGPETTWTRDRRNRRVLVRNGSTGSFSYRSAGTDAPAAALSVGIFSTLWEAPDAVGRESVGLTLGAAFEDRVAAAPGYWRYAHEGTSPRRAIGIPPLPDARTGAWRVAEETDGELALELTDDDAVAAALLGDADKAGDAEVTASRIRVRIDTDRGVVTSGDARFETAPVEGSDAPAYDVRTGFAVETGVSVARPDELGRARPSEWLWKLAAY